MTDEIRRRRCGHVLRKERNLKGRGEWNDLQKPYGEGRWKKNPGRRDGPVRPTESGVQPKTALVGERMLQRYASHDADTANELSNQRRRRRRFVFDGKMKLDQRGGCSRAYKELLFAPYLARRSLILLSGG